MTEGEWLGENHLEPKLKFLGTGFSPRKMRLFACACCRRVQAQLGVRRHPAIEVGEAFADGDAELMQLVRAYQSSGGKPMYVGNYPAMPDTRKAAEQALLSAASRIAEMTRPDFRQEARRRESQAQVPLFHDVFGNPFRAVSLDSAWLTHDVTDLAQAAYDQRILPVGNLEPLRLAILADALEEGGCTAGEILGHLRETGPHVRGCWVIDLILGKQ